MKYKIGITEAGDAAIDTSWINKVRNNEVDGAIIITKNPLHRDFLCNLCDCYRNKQNLVFHSTITGLPACLEPAIPPATRIIKELNNTIIEGAFPRENIVIRIDPIIPTIEGIEAARGIFELAAGFGYKRFRVSVIDMYPHVRERFKQIGYPLPYGAGFAPSIGHLARVDTLLAEIKSKFPNIVIESCAEQLKEAIPQGCVSKTDLTLMGLDVSNIEIDNIGYQRKGCLCYSGKTELLNNKCQCPNKCAYCYWR